MELKGIKLTGSYARKIAEDLRRDRESIYSGETPKRTKEDIEFLKKCMDTHRRLTKHKTIGEVYKLIEDDIFTKEELLSLKNRIETSLSSKLDNHDYAPDELW